MLYARGSLNYAVSIAIVRRAALLAAWPFRSRIGSGHLGAHLRTAEQEGLGTYLQLERFTHASTDGPSSPFARVYDLPRVRRDFRSFRLVSAHKEFMHAPPLPVHGLPGASIMGWHLWVELARLSTSSARRLRLFEGAAGTTQLEAPRHAADGVPVLARSLDRGRLADSTLLTLTPRTMWGSSRLSGARLLDLTPEVANAEPLEVTDLPIRPFCTFAPGSLGRGVLSVDDVAVRCSARPPPGLPL